MLQVPSSLPSKCKIKTIVNNSLLCFDGFFFYHANSINNGDLGISVELIDHKSPTQASPAMSLKPFVKHVVQLLEIVTPIPGRADATPSLFQSGEVVTPTVSTYDPELHLCYGESA